MVRSDITTALTENLPHNTSFIQSFFDMSDRDLATCGMFNFKLILFVIFVLITVSCLTTMFASILGPSASDEEFTNSKEHFSDDLLFSYKDTVHPNYSNYQTAALTAAETADGSYTTLQFGQANRTVSTMEDGKKYMLLEVSCDLFVINGNPFGETSTTQGGVTSQKYLVYVKQGDKVQVIDELTKIGRAHV